MKKNVKRFVSVALCVLMILSCTGCGRDLSALTEHPSEQENSKMKWSIYLYMVGSDLESYDLDQLTKYTNMMVDPMVEELKKEIAKTTADRMQAFTDEVEAQGATLPDALYTKTTPKAEVEKNTDPDMDGYATLNLNMILNSEIPEGVQFIVQTGGAKRWQSEYVNPNLSQRFLIDCDGITELSATKVVNMADPATLEDFVVYAKDNFPAEHELMVFWDHGGGYSGYGCDEIFGEDMLTMREITGALAKAKQLFGQSSPLFDMIGFDACLMGNLETARLFEDYADYFLASAEEMAGEGWGYDRMTAALNANPAITPEELGRVIARVNVENVQYEDGDDSFPATFSLIDLRQIEPLYEAYAALIKKALKLSLKDTANLAAISRAAFRSLSYAYGGCGGYNLIDLGQFMDQLSSFMPEECQKVKAAMPDCILDVCRTSYFTESSGMSVFFPCRAEGEKTVRKFLNYLYDFSDNPDIDALAYYKLTGCLNDSLQEYVTGQGYGSAKLIDYQCMEDIPFLEPEDLGNGNLGLALSKEQATLTQSVQFGLAYMDEETGDVAHFSELPRTTMDKNGHIVSSFNLTWPSINGNPLPAQVVSEDAAQIVYRVPILYYDVDCYLMFYYSKATKKYTIGGINFDPDNTTGMGDRNATMMDDGDEFSVVYQYENLDSNASESVYIDFVYSPDLTITESRLEDGTYLEYLRCDDLRADSYYSAVIVLVIENGKIADQYLDESIGTISFKEKE